MTREEAKQVTFDCQVCGGLMRPTVIDGDEGEGLDFVIPYVTCEQCGAVEKNKETTATLLGL